MPAITTENLAMAIVKVMAAQALSTLRPNFIMGGLVNRSYEAVFAKAGDTVTVPLPPTLVAHNLAETGSVQTQNPSPGNTELVLDTHAEASFQIPDVAKAIASMDILKTYMEPALVALATRMESDLLSHYPRMTRNPLLGAAATALTEATVDQAETVLFDSYVPESEVKNLVVSSGAYSDLRKIPRFSETQTVGDGSSIRTAQVGRIKNFNVYRSQLVPKVDTTTFNQAFSRDALGLVTRKLPQPLPGTGAIAEYTEEAGFGMRIVMSYNSNSLAQQFTADVLFGTGVLRDSHGVVVRT